MDEIERKILSHFPNSDLIYFHDDLGFLNHINTSLSLLKKNFDKLVNIEKKFDDNSINELFLVSISSLQTFVLSNWIYIEKLSLDNDLLNFLNLIPLDLLKKNLGLNNIDYQPEIRHSQLLLISQLILKRCPNNEIHFLIWKLRFLIIFSSIINSFKIDIGICHEELILKINEVLKNNQDKNFKLRINLEICQFYLKNNNVQHIEKLLLECKNLTNLNIEFKGALGKKTRFQQQAKSILFVNLSRSSKEEDFTKLNEQKKDLPIDLILNDDTLLSKPKFLDGNISSNLKLTDDEETLILTIVKFNSKCGVNEDNILKEETIIYLNCLLSNATVFSVIFESLYQRSIFESTERRKVERSMIQLNELLKRIKINEINIKDQNKLSLFYSSSITPIWKIKVDLAKILISLGCVKEALQIYEELGHWEEIVYCYVKLNRKNKAVEVINQQILIKETPFLLCLLGDVTEEISYYEKAWKLSEYKSYLSQKRLGYHYFNIKDYEKASICFKKSLELNKMQLDTLQRLGFVSLILEDYELAVNSYRRVVEWDLDNYQAWNNLAKAYIKLNKKFKAFKTFQESLKYNYENWKIWENYIAVSTDVGCFSDVITAWNRLIDLKTKYNDDQIMDILINYLCKEIKEGQENNLLIKRTLELLGRMTASFECSSDLWILYAKFLINLKNQDVEKIFNCMNKSLRSMMTQIDWYKDADKIKKNLLNLILLIDYFEKCLPLVQDFESRKKNSASFRLTFKSMITLIQNKNEYWSTNDLLNDSINKDLNKISEKMNIFDC